MSKSRTEIDKEIMYRKIMPSASKRDVYKRQLVFHLYCPESYIGIFESLVPEFRNIMEEHGYKASGIEVERMDHVRSLMEVFKNLPFKRTGVDVKI